jgi:hypothetical protein
VFGILDLIVAVGTGFMTAPSRFVPFEVQPTSELMASLAKLRREARASQSPGRVAGARA